MIEISQILAGNKTQASFPGLLGNETPFSPGPNDFQLDPNHLPFLQNLHNFSGREIL
jgi:hypothetical protein